MSQSKKIIIIGAGGHASVLAETLIATGANLLGFTDADPEQNGKNIFDLFVLGNDEAVARFKPQEVFLVNGIGSVGDTSLRRKIFENFKLRGYQFARVIHPSAILSQSSVLGEGVQIMAGTIVQTRTSIGDNTIVNTGAVIDHDGSIGSHVHIAPRAVLSGAVTVGDGTHIGTGAVVIQSVSVGSHCVIGAGSLIHKDIADSTKALGTPAKTSLI